MKLRPGANTATGLPRRREAHGWVQAGRVEAEEVTVKHVGGGIFAPCE
jgi:hypothetical protein